MISGKITFRERQGDNVKVTGEYVNSAFYLKITFRERQGDNVKVTGEYVNSAFYLRV